MSKDNYPDTDPTQFKQEKANQPSTPQVESGQPTLHSEHRCKPQSLDRYWYECQERAMAPGIGEGWPEVINAPHTKNARLVRREWVKIQPCSVTHAPTSAEVAALVEFAERACRVLEGHGEQVAFEAGRAALKPFKEKKC